jgi:prepilin-type N-terminal cleavage/methylation domain-containing protein
MMKLKSFRNFSQKQSGFTLVEVLIGVVLIGIIGTTIAMVVNQTVSGNLKSSDSMTAINNVRSAVDWISEDARMVKNSVDLAIPGVLMRIEWEDYAPPNGEPPFTYRVDYTIADAKLYRRYQVWEDSVLTVDNTIMISGNITSITPTFIGQELTVTVTATADSESETRTFTIIMRNIPQ